MRRGRPTSKTRRMETRLNMTRKRKIEPEPRPAKAATPTDCDRQAADPNMTGITTIAATAQYLFCVGRCEGRWIGFTVGRGPKHRNMMSLLPQIASDYRLGLEDRDEAVRQTTAIAQDAAAGYGRIEEWHVPAGLIADPDDYRCDVCGEICCGNDHEAKSSNQ